MKTLQYLALSAALFAAAPAAPVWASLQLLSSEELTELQNKGATPEDHARLASHFEAEAAALEQEAKSHEAMSKRYDPPAKVGSLKTGMAQHCVNLARDLNQAANEARQLAKSHRAMADGTGKLAQPAADSLWATPQLLADEELAALQMKGATAEDHLKVAAHFQAEAEALEQQAETHDAMAKQYNRPNLPPKVASLSSGMPRHCANLSRALRQAAHEAGQLSENHKALANAAGR